MTGIFDRLREEISITEEDKFAVFDFDNTCIINDIGEATLAYLCENNLLRDQTLLDRSYDDISEYHRDVFLHYHTLLEEGKNLEAYALMPQLLSGFSTDEIADLVEKVIWSEGQEITHRELFGIRISKGLAVRELTRRVFDYLLESGVSINIVSASSVHVVKAAFDIFFPGYEASCFGVESVIEDGILSKNIVYPFSFFEGKVGRIRDRIHESVKPILAMGDSLNDKSMLEYARIPVAVNTHNELSNIAKARGWLMIG